MWIKDQARAREAYYILNNPCVNKCVPGRTTQEYRDSHKDETHEYNKQYREIHKDNISEFQKEYRESHKEQTKEYNAQYRLKKTLEKLII